MPTPSFLANRCCSLPLLWIQWAGGAGVTHSPLLLPNKCPSPALKCWGTLEHSCTFFVSSSPPSAAPQGPFPSSLTTLALKTTFYSINICHHSFLELLYVKQQLWSTAVTLHHLLELPPSQRLWPLHFPSLATLLFLPVPLSPLLNLIFFLSCFCQQSPASRFFSLLSLPSTTNIFNLP